ncbi:MAG: hypothetical protein BGN97_09865 [Microbacterium sp. 69-10]|nr:MAG: hypothetical protein BGN97_09865 [Microbacterium sp. 69-10]
MTEMHAIPELDEPEPTPLDDDESEEQMRLDVGFVAEPPHPVNWNLLTADEARDEWAELDKWVTWLRHTYGLPASVIPPFWHRHAELVGELSALHLHWLCAYDPEQNGSAPSGWHRDFAETRQRLRDWVAASGTRLDRDRPTRQTAWPGEEPADPVEDIVIPDRAEDFRAFVEADVARRQAAEEAFYASLGVDPSTGEVPDDDDGSDE